MFSRSLSSIVIIEPDHSLLEPYSFINAVTTTRVTSVQEALNVLHNQSASLVTVSASLPPEESLQLFESLRALTVSHAAPLTPVLVVVNSATRISNVLGTTWGNKLGVISSQATKQELDSTFERILA